MFYDIPLKLLPLSVSVDLEKQLSKSENKDVVKLLQRHKEVLPECISNCLQKLEQVPASHAKNPHLIMSTSSKTTAPSAVPAFATASTSKPDVTATPLSAT